MKNCLFTLVLCMLATTAFTQTSPRVVFYRNDSHEILPFHKQRLYMDKNEIHRIKNHEVFVFNAKGTRANYYMRPTITRKLDLNSDPNSITFVEVRLRAEKLMQKSVIEKKSLAEFKLDYDTKKWLRKSLKKAGYNSVNDLVENHRLSMR